MIKDAQAGDGTQAQGPIPAGMMGYREGERPLYSYDPAKCEEEVSVHPPPGRVLKHTADTRKPVETGYFGPFLSAFQRTLASRR